MTPDNMEWEIRTLRNKLNICIHGNNPCNIVDEGCSACMTGGSPPTEVDANSWRFLRSAYARGELTYFAENCGSTEAEVEAKLRGIIAVSRASKP